MQTDPTRPQQRKNQAFRASPPNATSISWLETSFQADRREPVAFSIRNERGRVLENRFENALAGLTQRNTVLDGGRPEGMHVEGRRGPRRARELFGRILLPTREREREMLSHRNSTVVEDHPPAASTTTREGRYFYSSSPPPRLLARAPCQEH